MDAIWKKEKRISQKRLQLFELNLIIVDINDMMDPNDITQDKILTPYYLWSKPARYDVDAGFEIRSRSCFDF